MEFKDILDISLNVKRIRNLTENEHILESVDKILDILQKDIDENVKKQSKGLKAIIAHNNKGVIGNDDKLIWYCKDDLIHFKKMTDNSTLLVGYNTAKSLPELKNRKVIVDDRYEILDTKDIDWCIGGKKTYEKYCHLFTELHISLIDDDTNGNIMFPDLSNINKGCKIYYYKFLKN